MHPSAGWIERTYSNGAYARWEPIACAVTGRFPWSLGDLAVLLGVAAVVWRITMLVRERRRTIPSSLRRISLTLLDLAVVLAVYCIWFELAWGWNYDRAPVETRLRYDATLVNDNAVVALRNHAIDELNALAPIAHVRSNAPLDISALRAAWLPVVRRAGDIWTPQTGAPKPTLADPFMNATATSGFINPLTLNVQLASDLLWFERPFDLAHEWSHVAAYAREDEANYLAALTCLRSRDPVMRYSGWLELFLALPQPRSYTHSTFIPLVWSDFAALRTRNARRVNLTLAHWSWRTYNVYLKSNRIAAGIANYDEFTRLIVGIPLDREGLPETR